MTEGEIVAVCGVTIAALSLIYSALKDMRSNDRENGKISALLAGIKDNLQNLRDGLSRLEGKQEGIDQRLTVVEQSAKSAHHRIDEHESRIGNLEKKI